MIQILAVGGLFSSGVDLAFATIGFLAAVASAARHFSLNGRVNPSPESPR